MKYELTDLIDVAKTQRLLQNFFDAVGVPAAIIDLDGKVLVSSHWQRVCTDFHRVNEITCRRCIESDTMLANDLLRGETFSLYRCLNGLTDAASPIIIEGEHLANMFVGQFFLENPDLGFFSRQADEFGFDKSAYLDAISEIPIVAQDTLPSTLSFLTSFAEMVASLGLKQLRQFEIERELRTARESLEIQNAKLQQSEEDLNRAQAVAQIGSWRMDVQQNVLHWSDESYRIFDIPLRLPMSYEAFLATVHHDDRDLVDQSWKAALRGKPYDIEHRIIVGETIRWVHEQAELEFDEHRALRGGFGTVQDITERKRIEEELLRAREGLELRVQERTAQLSRAYVRLQEKTSELEALLDTVPAAVLIARDKECTRISGNRATFDIFELPIGGSVSKTAPENVWPSQHKFLKNGEEIPLDKLPVQRAAKGEKIFDYDFELAFNDGRVRQLLGNAVPLRDSEGDVYGAVAAFLDITERKKAEIAVRERARQIDAFFAHSLTPLVFLDRDLNFIRVNEAYAREYGRDPEDFIGKNHFELYPSSELQAEFEQVVSTQKPYHVYGRPFTFPDHPEWGISYWDLSVEPISDNGEVNFLVFSLNNVTEKKKAERELKDFASRLEKMNAELGEFAFIASHDLQEPLRKIQAFGELLQENYVEVLDNKGKDYLNRMATAAGRMRGLIEQLLRYSRVGTRSEPFKRVDLNAVVNEVIQVFELRLQRGGGRIDSANLPSVDADESQMRQLFQNLISNALKYSKKTEMPRIRIFSEIDGNGFCRIYVEDNGIGFDELYKDKIFSPFKRLHGRSEYEGTGMGLAICRRIVERHNGTISAKGEPGVGATFIIMLPLKQPGSEIAV